MDMFDAITQQDISTLPMDELIEHVYTRPAITPLELELTIRLENVLYGDPAYVYDAGRPREESD